jgi:hypothetical protein
MKEEQKQKQDMRRGRQMKVWNSSRKKKNLLW